VRGAGAGLIDVNDELIAQRAPQDFVGCLHDRAGNPPVEASERLVGLGRGALDQYRRDNKIGGRAKIADAEVLDGTRGLNAVIGVSRNVASSAAVQCLRKLY
jgi:hypothetical protein